MRDQDSQNTRIFAQFTTTHLRNGITLTLAAGSIPFGLIWYWIARHIFPLNKQDHERALEKIKNKHTKS